MLVQKFQDLKLGDPSANDTKLGPQADSTQAHTVAKFLGVGRDEGSILTGGERSKVGKNFIEPTIFDGVAASGRINLEEVFGPVLVVHTFKTMQEAIDLANDTECEFQSFNYDPTTLTNSQSLDGLYASVFSENIDTALHVAHALEAGNVGVNCTSPYDAFEIPFGGYKQSGIGRSKGSNAVLNWTEEKSIYIRQKPVGNT